MIKEENNMAKVDIDIVDFEYIEEIIRNRLVSQVFTMIPIIAIFLLSLKVLLKTSPALWLMNIVMAWILKTQNFTWD